MRVWKVGRYWTNVDRKYAERVRAIECLTNPDPGEPVEMVITEEEWARLTPTAIATGDIAEKPSER